MGKGSCTIHYPDSMTLTEISIISALLVGTPNLRLGGGVELLPVNSTEGANCSASMCRSSVLDAALVHTDKGEDKGNGLDDPIALQPHCLSSCTSTCTSSNSRSSSTSNSSNSSSNSAGSKSSMEAFKPHSYFRGVPWGKLLDSPVPASFRPSTVTTHEARGDYGLYEDFNFPQTSKSHRDMVQETPKAAVNFTS